jgi:sugar phosphate permease
MFMVGMLLFGPDALLSGVAAQDLGGASASGTAAGLVNGMGSVGALCQGLVTVSVEQAFGWNALFYVLFGTALIGAVCLLPSLRAQANVTSEVI